LLPLLPLLLPPSRLGLASSLIERSRRFRFGNEAVRGESSGDPSGGVRCMENTNEGDARENVGLFAASSGGVTWPCTRRDAVSVGMCEIRLSRGEMSPGGAYLSGDDPDEFGGDGWPAKWLFVVCSGAITVADCESDMVTEMLLVA